MSWIFKLTDIPASGLSLDRLVEPAELELSQDDGKVIGHMRCVGSLAKPDDRTVYFQGLLEGRIARECVRCLSVFEESLNLPCLGLFKKTSRVKGVDIAGGRHAQHQDEDRNDEDDVYPIDANQVDLLPLIREHVILAAPFQALCSDACLGLCQGCGANLNTEKCSCVVPAPVMESEGVFHPDLSIADKQSSGRSPGNRRRRSVRK